MACSDIQPDHLEETIRSEKPNNQLRENSYRALSIDMQPNPNSSLTAQLDPEPRKQQVITHKWMVGIKKLREKWVYVKKGHEIGRKFCIEVGDCESLGNYQLAERGGNLGWCCWSRAGKWSFLLYSPLLLVELSLDWFLKNGEARERESN